jgi:lysophospholipase L1-like esterase
MKILKHLVYAFLLVVMVLTPFEVLAVTPETLKAINYDAPFFDNRATCREGAPVLPTDLKGNDNIEKAFRYFIDLGLKPEQSAAIVGNFQAESGVDPARNQIGGGPGRGIAQWSVGERWLGVLALAKEQGKSEFDLGLQLDFVWKELQGSESRAYEKFLQETTLANMTITFERLYERAGIPNHPKRIGFAQQILKLYGSTAANAPSATNTPGAVYMIGDSITEGIAGAGVATTLDTIGWKPTVIDASGSRSITAPGTTGTDRQPGLAALDNDKAAIKAAKVIFVGLGTNPGGSINQTTYGADIDRFVDKLRTPDFNPTAPIYWLNVISPAITDKDARNATLADRASAKQFTVIDATTMSLNFGDQIHPNDYTTLKDKVVASLIGAPDVATSNLDNSCAEETVGNGQDTQYIDGFAVYNQYDSAWRDKPFGSSTIGPSGCGPAAMAMIVTALTGKKVLPPEVATVAAEMYVPGAGSSWQIGPFVAAKYGLKSAPVEANVAAISQALINGGLVVAPGQGAQPFTSGGHFIVIRAVTADGKWRVGDSGHRDTSSKNWDPETLVAMMRDGGVYAITK